MRDAWIKALQPSVVLIDLKDDFDILELLGRGNFAKVHKCSRKGGDKDKFYALKTIEKKMLMKSRENIDSMLTEIDVLR
jgi:serine/threonine protein kinase